jgi:hypothetical protein
MHFTRSFIDQKNEQVEGDTMKPGYFILGALMLVGLLIYVFAPPIVIVNYDYTLKDVGLGLFGLGFFLSFLAIVSRLSHKKD